MKKKKKEKKELKFVCPSCKKDLKEVIFSGVKTDKCEDCEGYWFQKDEFRLVKDKEEKKINWMDIDLWENENKFKISKDSCDCPDCNISLYEVNYGDSNIKVDFCKECEGVWLDKGEFVKIMEYLKEKAGDKIMKEYFKTLVEETGEIFVGPEPLDEELRDLLTILKLFKYRFAGKHPFIARAISHIPKS